jgi:hypothetical protein
MADLTEAELIELVAYALHHSGQPGNAERIDIRFATERARAIVHELVEREGLVFTRRPDPPSAAGHSKSTRR